MFMSDRLHRLARVYHIEAKKCVRGKSYLAACVMQGAALEAVLQAMCCIYPEAVKKTTAYQKRLKRGFQRKKNRALDFKYVELISIAAELGWFPPKRSVVWGRRTNVAGFVHELRKMRNYVHPGVWAPERKGTTKFTKRLAMAALEIFEVAHDWLLHHVEKNLADSIERRDKRHKEASLKT